MQSDSGPPPPPSRPPAPPWLRTVFWMFALTLFAGSSLYVFRSCRELPADTVSRSVDKTVQVVTNLARAMRDVAEAFHQGSYTTTLLSFGTELENTKQFQFKKIRQLELFRHTDHATTAFGYIPLPDIIVEARAPVEYAYYLDLNEPWSMVLRDGVIHVFTPRIRYNRPSVDISRLEYQVHKDSVLRDADPAIEYLQKSLISLANLKARENLKLVRDTGREPVAEFVQQWLARAFRDGTNYPVIVHFDGEVSREAWAAEPSLLESSEP